LQAPDAAEVSLSLPQKDTSSEENVSVAPSVQNTSNVTRNKKIGPAVTAKPKKTSLLSDAGECLFMPSDVLPCKLCHILAMQQCN